MIRFLFAIVLLTGVFSPSARAAGAWVPGLRIVPDSAQGVVEITDVPTMRQAFKKTGLGRLLATPEMDQAGKAFQESFETYLGGTGGSVSLDIDNLLDATTGELVVAWFRANEPRHPYRICVMADARGDEAKANIFLDSVKQELVKRKGISKTATVSGKSVTVFTMPNKIGKLDVDQAVFGLVEGRMLFSDRVDIMEQLIAAITAGGANPSVSQAADFQATRAKTVEKFPGQINWFARPLGMGRIMRAVMREGEISQKDLIGLLERQGFEDLKSIGGVLELAAAPHDWVHRYYIYAPTAGTGDSRFRLAAKMLDFPNESPPPLPSWVTIETSSIARINWKLKNAFWALETLVDDIVGDKVFRDSLQGIIEDAEGPQIDLAKDLVGNFSDGLLMFTNNQQPSDLDSERTMLAIPLTNVKTVTIVIRKLEESDPDVHRFEHPKHEIWEVRREAGEEDTFSEFQFAKPSPPNIAVQRPLLDSWAVTIHQGYLLLASHTSLLVELLDQKNNQHPANLAADATVLAALEKLTGHSDMAMIRCLRPELAWRVKYDLLRAGKLSKSDSILATLVRRAGEEIEKSGKLPHREIHNLKFPGAKLPAFSFVIPYLGSIGNSLTTTSDGWEGASLMTAPQK